MDTYLKCVAFIQTVKHSDTFQNTIKVELETLLNYYYSH